MTPSDGWSAAEGVVAVTTYHAIAKSWAHGWELHIEGVGVTQARTLASAARMVRDYLALDLGGQPESYDVTITAELDGNLAADAEPARRAVREAEQAQRDATAAQRTVAPLHSERRR